MTLPILTKPTRVITPDGAGLVVFRMMDEQRNLTGYVVQMDAPGLRQNKCYALDKLTVEEEK